MKFGEWLKKNRMERGMTREQLGAFAGITASTIRQIEVGAIKRPPMVRLEGFAKAFGIEVSEVLAALNRGAQ